MVNVNIILLLTNALHLDSLKQNKTKKTLKAFRHTNTNSYLFMNKKFFKSLAHLVLTLLPRIVLKYVSVRIPHFFELESTLKLM